MEFRRFNDTYVVRMDHGRALYRKAVTFWQKERIKNPFGFTK